MNLGSIRDLRVSSEGEGLSHATVTIAKRSVKIIQITPRKTPSLETMEITSCFKVFKNRFFRTKRSNSLGIANNTRKCSH
jgi:hypothetical protein